MAGNPNSGKSTLFNMLTGLRQKTGNFPGVTVDIHKGICVLPNKQKIEIIDLPGTYSLFPKSIDEQVTTEVLSNKQNADYPDVTLMVADSTNLKRSLYLCTQLIDTGLPVILVLNMIDEALKRTIVIEETKLSQMLGVPVVSVNSKQGEGIAKLKSVIANYEPKQGKPQLDISKFSTLRWSELKENINANSDFDAFVLYINNLLDLNFKRTVS